jgi:glutaredoxin
VSVGMDIFVFSDFISKCKLAKTTALINGFVLAFIAANKLTQKVKKQHIIEQLKKWKATFPQININDKLMMMPDKTQLAFPKDHTFILANSLTP